MLFAHLKRISGSVDCAYAGQAEPRTSSYSPPPPKISGNWRSSSLIQRQPSPCESKRRRFALRAAAAPAHRDRVKTGFFNEIDVKQTLEIAAAAPFGREVTRLERERVENLDCANTQSHLTCVQPTALHRRRASTHPLVFRVWFPTVTSIEYVIPRFGS
jgi:hypothetical protein